MVEKRFANDLDRFFGRPIAIRGDRALDEFAAVHSAAAAAIHRWGLARSPSPGFGSASLRHLKRQWGLRRSFARQARNQNFALAPRVIPCAKKLDCLTSEDDAI